MSPYGLIFVLNEFILADPNLTNFFAIISLKNERVYF
jgi:hypothetical protein